MRKCLAAKRLKSRLNSSNAMEGASLDEQTVESTKTVTTKINNDRIKKDALPINPPPNKKQLKIRAKELAASNVVSGRRMVCILFISICLLFSRKRKHERL